VSEARASAGIERIAIVGAGLAGLALALGLRRGGLSPDVVERRDRRSDVGAGIYLVGNAVRALAALGVQDPLAFEDAVVLAELVASRRDAREIAPEFARDTGPVAVHGAMSTSRGK
jgi:2-polyprenyl-6-methoxyphenol hydroxylase-like FAD-dependent oxidoreductase